MPRHPAGPAADPVATMFTAPASRLITVRNSARLMSDVMLKLSRVGAVVGRVRVRRQQVVHDAVELVPRCLPEVVTANDETRTGVELLVLQVAAGELAS